MEPTREYRVELDVYNGPLDLLLYLLKRDELDIYDIPITRILDTYMRYVEALKDVGSRPGVDINVAGEFLVMAATLMEIKSAMLLPKAKPDEGKEGRSAAQDLADPRYELVQQLLEYKRFKDTAVLLERKQSEHQERFARYPAKRGAGEEDEPPPVDMDEVQVWDLLSAFSRLMAEIGQRKPKVHEVAYDDTPIELHASDIEDRLKRDGRLTLRQLVVGRAGKSEIIGVFLALLELIRQKKILVHQGDDLSDLQIDPAPEEHRRTYEHASLALSEGAAATRDGGADGTAAVEGSDDPSADRPNVGERVASEDA
ncbi:MAG: Segregation and condensation protein A [uncultured Phycisphaerae bacterium]|uniref:Segregation and condensation protein A n=1 Tax=uncultured Phycisphaerae bacterium TaxID=904963 RepID=A0A6J4NBE3_9BACT|nr:MAG: Segregation and condensation protein A [uncultured Phycisphaerae bacterium]